MQKRAQQQKQQTAAPFVSGKKNLQGSILGGKKVQRGPELEMSMDKQLKSVGGTVTTARG